MKKIYKLLLGIALSCLWLENIHAQLNFNVRKTWEDGNYDIRMASAPVIQPCFVDGSALSSDRLVVEAVLPEWFTQRMAYTGNDSRSFGINNHYDLSAKPVPEYLLAEMGLADSSDPVPKDDSEVKYYPYVDNTIGNITILALTPDAVYGGEEFILPETYEVWEQQITTVLDELGILVSYTNRDQKEEAVNGVDYYQFSSGKPLIKAMVYDYDPSCGIVFDQFSATVDKYAGLLYSDNDDDNSTFCSSMSILGVSDCATIEAAYLYWFGKVESTGLVYDKSCFKSYNQDFDVDQNISLSAARTVKFKSPDMSSYVDVSAIEQYGGGGATYVCVADVTSYVEGVEAGEFWVGNVLTTPTKGDGGTFGGWVLVVVYESPNSPPRSIALWDGFDFIYTGDEDNVSITGLKTPATDDFTSYIGFASLDGENTAEQLYQRGASPESIVFEAGNGDFKINPNKNRLIYGDFGAPLGVNGELYNPCNMPDYDSPDFVPFAKDGISSLQTTTYSENKDGTWSNGNQIERIPSNRSTFNYDAHHIRLPEAAINPNTSSAKLTISAGPQGGMTPFMTYIVIETLQPKLELTNEADTLKASLEQDINFKLTVENTGSLISFGDKDYVLDTLDKGVTYVSCSESNTTVDDLSSGRQVVKIKLPKIDVNESLEIKLVVKVKSFSSNKEMWENECKREIRNTAWTLYEGVEGEMLSNFSNASDCRVGTDIVIALDDVAFVSSDADTIGPINIDDVSNPLIIEELQAKMLEDGADVSVLDQFRYTYNMSGKPIHPDSIFNLQEKYQEYRAVRSLAGTGSEQCEEIYVFIYQPNLAPTFELDTTNISCYGIADGAISATATYERDETGNTIQYTVVEGLVTDEAGLNSATVVTSQAMSTKLDILVENLEYGVYTIAATDMNGELYYLPFELRTPDEIIVTMSPVTICEGDEAAVSPDDIEGRLPNELSFSWEKQDDRGNWSVIAGQVIAEYRAVLDQNTNVRLISTDGTCSDTADVEISVDPRPVFNMGPYSICNGESAFLEAPAGMDSYKWSTVPAETSQSISVSEAGNVGVTIAKGACLLDTLVRVAVDTVPVIGMETEMIFCESGTIEVPLENCTYLWSNNSRAKTLDVNGSGIFGLTVTSSAGCEASAEIDVTVTEKPELGLKDTALCEYNTVTYNLPNEYSYEWSDPSIIGNSFTTNQGQYYVTVTSGDCEIVDSVTVTEKLLPRIDFGDNTAFCNRGEISAGFDGDSYIWSTGETTKEIIVEESGNYSITVTKDDCSAEKSQDFTVYTSPEFDLGADTAICPGENLILDAYEGADSYTWNTGETDRTITVSTADVYTVTVTVGSGPGSCSTTASRTVNVKQLPSLSFDSPAEICSGDSVSIIVSGADSYVWDSGDTVETVTALLSATKEFSVTGILDGCEDTYKHTVIVNPMPEVVASPWRKTLCPGESAKMSVTTDAASIEWSEGLGSDLTYTVSPSENTTYYVTGTTGNCSKTDSVMVYTNADVIVTPGADTAICIGSTVRLSTAGNNAKSYVWGNGLGTDSVYLVSPQATTTYHVTAYFNGCEADDQMVVTVNPLPEVVANASETEICKGEEVLISASGAETYLWETGETDDYTVTPEVTTSYSVTGTDSNNCSSTDEVEVYVNDLPEPQIVSDAADNEACEGETLSLSLTGTYSSYNWSTGSSEDKLELTSVGKNTYSVTVADANDCTAEASAEAEIKANPEVDLGGDETLCVNEVLDKELNIADATYIWSTGSTSNSTELHASDQSDMKLSVEVTVRGCTSYDEISVAFTELPNYEILGDTAIYKGDVAYFKVSKEFASYMWNTADYDRFIEKFTDPDSPGSIDYWVMVTDEYDCKQGDTINLDLYAPPQLTLEDVELCSGESKSIHVDAGFDAYVWSDGSVSRKLVVTEPGTYSVTASKFYPPMEMYDEVTVIVHDLPVFELGNDTSLCANEPITLSVDLAEDQNDIFEWSTREATSSIISTETGVYSVTVTSESGCEEYDDVAVELKPVPDAPSDDQFIFCVNTGIQSIISLGNNIKWYNQQGDSVFSGSIMNVGTEFERINEFSVTETADGCESDKATVLLKVSQPEFDLKIIGDSTICLPAQSELYMVEAVPAETYWKLKSQNNTLGFNTEAAQDTVSINFQKPGQDIIEVSAIDKNGCNITDSLIVNISPGPEPEFDHWVDEDNFMIEFYNTTEPVDIPETDITLDNTYLWFFGQQNESPVFVEADTVVEYEYGYYNVSLTATDEYGCEEKSSAVVFMNAQSSLFIPNALAPDHASDEVSQFKPKGRNMITYEVWIYDNWGNTVWYSNRLENGQPAENWDGTYEGEILKTDNYTWRIKAEFTNGTYFDEYGSVMLVR